MRAFLILGGLWVAAGVAQAMLVPELLPAFVRPDVGLLLGLAGIAYLRRETAILFLFALGAQADLLGSARFGLLTLGYLAAGALLLAASRELVRAGVSGAWLGTLAGTAVAHAGYVLVGWPCGVRVGLADALSTLGSLLLGAALFGLATAWGLNRLWSWTGLLSPEARGLRDAARKTRGWRMAWVSARRNS
jgi:hypothetical protein